MVFYKQQIVCIVIVIFIASFFFSTDRKTNSAKKYGTLLIVCAIQLLFDIASVYTVNHLDTVPEIVNRIVHILYMGFMLYLFVLMYKYLEALIEDEKGEKIHKIKWLYVPSIICILGLCFLPIEYVETPKGNYSYGAPIFLVYGCIALYIMLVVRNLHIYKENIPKKKRKAVIGTLLSEIPIVIYQIIDPTSLISCLAIVLIVLGLYMTVENPDARLVKLLEKETRRADVANQAKTNFLANMSHEIRTPINAVLGMNEMILRECKDEDILEYSKDIQGAAKSLLSIINDILDITKIEAGKLQIIIVEYDFLNMIHDVENMISFKAKSKELGFEVDIDENIPSILMGDDIRVRQILVNLLNNAVKYTHKGSVSLEVSLLPSEGEEDISRICFKVKDTGIGIKQEDIDKLYIPFERIEEKRNRNIEGTGLGINITMQLLSLLGSKLEIKSEYAKGSEFSFVLNQKIVDSKPIGKYTAKRVDENISNKAKGYEEYLYVCPDARVLVVDDNEMNRKVFKGLLKRTNIQIEEASSGKMCLEKVKNMAFDIIFMDHMMPEMDGVETLHEMQKMGEYPCKDTPVVILTANAIAGAKEEYMKEGFVSYLSKPIDVNNLDNLVVELLDEKLVTFIEADKVQSDDKNNPITSEMDVSDLPAIEGVDWKCAISHFKDQESMIDAVKSFMATLEYDAKELEKYYLELNNQDTGVKEDNLKMYRIKVHSMKSSAAIIGINSLAETAAILEAAANNNEYEKIEQMTQDFLKKWREYREHLEVFSDKSDAIKDANEFQSEIKEIFGAIKIAANDMDVDTLDELLEELKQYNFEGEQRELFENIQNAIINLDVDYLEELNA